MKETLAPANPPHILHATTETHLAAVRELFLEYGAWLGFSLCFQGFDQEVAELPGRYAIPTGRLLLATDGVDFGGVIALRDLGAGTCEMKRLYVRPTWRGYGLGHRLTAQILDEARAIGYSRMVLDTLPGRMDEAIKLYRGSGFTEITPYYDNPVAGVMFMAVQLR